MRVFGFSTEREILVRNVIKPNVPTRTDTRNVRVFFRLSWRIPCGNLFLPTKMLTSGNDIDLHDKCY